MKNCKLIVFFFQMLKKITDYEFNLKNIAAYKYR